MLVNKNNLVFRKDIQGLRAIAVLAVILFHYYPEILPGGFLGVDIFFVISGFIISSIIFKDLSNNSFKLGHFFHRRIKRIFPALVTVLVSTLTYGWFTLFPEEYKHLGEHIIAAGLFVSNFLLLSESGYFNVEAIHEPLLHLWSLGVEEQFYIGYPILLIIIWKLRKKALMISLYTIGICSLIYGMWLSYYQPMHFFYLPFSRFWQFLAGGIIAYYFYFNKNIVIQSYNFQKPLFQFFGIGILIFVFLFTSSHANSLGIVSLIAVIGTSFIVMSPNSWINKQFLASHLMIFIGNISYPLYLWHWVVISYFNIVEIDPLPNAAIIFSIILTFGLSLLTYNFIERPIKKTNNLTNYILLFLMSIVIFFGIYIYKGEGIPSRLGLYYSQFSEVNYINETECKSRYILLKDDYCGLSNVDNNPTVMLLGDSHARAYSHGLMKAYQEQNDIILAFGKGGCPPFLGVDNDRHKEVIPCDRVFKQAIEYLKRNNEIHTVVMAGQFSSYLEALVPSQATEKVIKNINYIEKDERIRTFVKGFTSMLDALSEINVEIIFMHQVPILSIEPRDCIQRPNRLFTAEIDDCSSDTNKSIELTKKYRSVIDPILKIYPDVKIFNPRLTFCNLEKCIGRKNGYVRYYDRYHLNKLGSSMVTEAFKYQVLTND